MPSTEGNTPCARCARHSRVDFQVKPHAKWTRATQSFVTQMYLSINYSSWRRTGCPGVTQKQWGSDGQRTCRGIQLESAAKRKSTSTKESLSSENTTLISPMIISQMIDENQSKGNWPALRSEPSVYRPKQSLTHHVSVNIQRAFTVLPSRLKIQASLDDTTVPSDSPVTEKKQCQKQKKGFASITITARRVAVSSSDPAHGLGAVQKPSTASPTSSKVPTVLHRWLPPDHADQHASLLKTTESCSQQHERPQKQLFDPENEENGMRLQSSNRRGKASPSFTSCVHLQISQPCLSTVYYLDKSLIVRVDRPRMNCQKLHRSELSLTLHCSSRRLTADGVDGIANGEPIGARPQPKLLEGKTTPLRPTLSADLAANNVFHKERTNGVSLGRKYPSPRVFASALPALVDVPRGPDNVVMPRTGNVKQSGGYHTAFSLRLPNASDEAGTQMLEYRKKRCTVFQYSAMASRSLPDITSSKEVTAATDGPLKRKDLSKGTLKSKEIRAQRILIPKTFLSRSMCNLKASSRILSDEIIPRQNQLLKSDYEFHGSSDKRKEREEEEEKRERASRVTLSTARSPDVTREKNYTFTRPENSSQLEETPPAPRTLQEALEIHNPQFITRSQERLKKLEHMVQLRKSQQSDAPAGNHGALLRKLSSASTSSKKRQYTIPHPLSDNLFKPKERFIPEKEMHMRSKRIYDNLPEVKKKQEEKQKRIIIQSNRLRVEIFKKQLLDQLLHRNTE